MAEADKRNRKRPCIQLSGFSAKDKQACQGVIEGLGGTMPDSDSFRIESTHIIMKKLSRSEKYLGACATGKWVLTKKFMDESHRHGRWLDETPYEWSTKIAEDVRDPETIELLKAPGRWRRLLADGHPKPFTGWRTAVVVDNSQRKSIYKRLLSAGGAQVSEVMLPITRTKEVAEGHTHLIVDPKHAQCIAPVVRRGLPCVDPVYIGDFLTKDPQPDPIQYLIGQSLSDLPEMTQSAIKMSCERLLTSYNRPPTPESSASQSSTHSSLQDFDLSTPQSKLKAKPVSVVKRSHKKSSDPPARTKTAAKPHTFNVKPGTPRRSARTNVESQQQTPACSRQPSPAKFDEDSRSSENLPVVVVKRISQQSPVRVIKTSSGYKMSPVARLKTTETSDTVCASTSPKRSRQSREDTQSQAISSSQLVYDKPVASPSSSQGSSRIAKVSLQRLSEQEIIDLVNKSTGSYAKSTSLPSSRSSQKSDTAPKRNQSPLSFTKAASDTSLMDASFGSTTSSRKSKRDTLQSKSGDKTTNKIPSTTPKQVQHQKRQIPLKTGTVGKDGKKQLSILSMFKRIPSPPQTAAHATKTVFRQGTVPQMDSNVVGEPILRDDAAKSRKARGSVEVDSRQRMDPPRVLFTKRVTDSSQQDQGSGESSKTVDNPVPVAEFSNVGECEMNKERTQNQPPVVEKRILRSVSDANSSTATKEVYGLVAQNTTKTTKSPATKEKTPSRTVEKRILRSLNCSNSFGATRELFAPVSVSIETAEKISAIREMDNIVSEASGTAESLTTAGHDVSVKAAVGLTETIHESAKKKLDMSDADDSTSITRPSASGSVIKFYKSPPHRPVSALSPNHKEAVLFNFKRATVKRKLTMDDTFPKLKQMKMFHVTNCLPWTPCHDLPLLNEDCMVKSNFPKSVSYQMSDPMAGIFDTCVDENRQCFGLDVFLSLTNSLRYPQPKTLHILMTVILQPSVEPYLSHRTYGCLRQILTQHPPTSPALQQLYLEAMRDPHQSEPSNNEEWEFLESVISQSMVTIDDVEEAQAEQFLQNNFLVLQFLVATFEKDFQVYMLNLKNQSPSDLTPLRLPLIHRVIWSHGGGAVMNHQCRSLISYLVDAIRCQKRYRMTLLYRMQSLVAMVATCLKVNNKTDMAHTMDDLDLPRQVSLFAKELAYRVGAELDDVKHLDAFFRTMQLPWLAVQIVQTILDTYEVFMPLELPDEDTLNLKLIVSKYFYLLPPIVQNGTLLSPTKRVLTPIQENEVMKSRKFRVTPRIPRTHVNTTIGKPMPPSSPTTNINVKPSPIKQRQMFRVNKRNAAGETPLMLACKQNNVTKVKELLTIPGIEVNAADYAGWTAIHEACNYGHLDCVQELLKYRPHRTIASYFNTGGAMEQGGKVNLLAVNGDGITPLHDSIMNGHVQVAQLLLQYGGKVLLNAKTRLGYTPVQLAESKEMLEMLENFCKSTAVPIPKKSPMAMSPDDFLNCSQTSLGQVSFNDGNTATFQPPPESYDTILGTGEDRCHVPESEGVRYILFIFYLLKHYLTVKEYGTTKAMLKSGVGITSEMLRSLSNKAFTSAISQFSAAKNNLSLPGRLPKFPLPSTSILSTHAWSNQGGDSERPREPPTPEKIRAELKDELGILRKLEMHVGGFESHIISVSREKQFDWSKSKMNSIKIIAK